MKKNNVDEVYTHVFYSKRFKVCKGKVYYYKEDRWRFVSDEEIPILIRTLLNEHERMKFSSGVINEVIARMVQDPELQMKFMEDEFQYYVNVLNGVMNIETGELEKKSKEKPFGYTLNFRYIRKEERSTTDFDRFLKTSFPYDMHIKKQLIEEILGYVISDYRIAKTGFFLIGESNSGKSTILELLRSAIPENQITAIPLCRLGNRFGLGKLSESRVNISTELNEKSFQAADIYKMLTSNEIVTGEHKGKKPFEFRLKCKSISAGNVIPNLGSIEGRDAILNRMILLYFPTSIPKEKQDLHLLEKLEQEKDSIFSNALDALVELRKNNFVFVTPEDSYKIKEQLSAEGRSLESFIEECCVTEKNARVHWMDLYEAYKEYCNNNLLEVNLTKNQFSQRVSRMEGLSRGKFRIDGSAPLAGIIGIRLKRYGEFDSKADDLTDMNNNVVTTLGSNHLEGLKEDRIPA